MRRSRNECHHKRLRPRPGGEETAKQTNQQANLITLANTKTEPRVDSRLIAQHLGIQHKNVLANIRQYVDHFKRFGILAFKTPVITGRGQPERYALLSEDQVYFLLSLSRNTDVVVDLKAQLVQAFREARQTQDVHQTEYLPAYHNLHDEIARLAGGSANERFVHMNVNKAINKVVGVRSGERYALPMPAKSLLIVAQSVARNAMLTAHDHKDGYRAAKVALGGLSQALEVAHA